MAEKQMRTRTLTILQADLVGSTTTVSSLTRQEMTDYIEEVNQQITHAIRQFGGDPFKFTGDGYLASFESASDCLLAAQQIQRNMSGRNLTIGDKAVGSLRIVAHTADVIVTEGDLLGDGVATVARLEKLAPPGAVYVTETVRGVCKRAEFEFEYVDTYTLRGIPDPVRVYELKSHEKLHSENGVYVVVSDIKRFSQLTRAVSPEVLEDYLSALHRIHRQAARTFSGVLAKILGDRVLMTFQAPADAVAAAIALQEDAMVHCQQRPDLPPIDLTIAITGGDVYRFAGDIYGAPINDAFSLASRLDDCAIVAEAGVFQQAGIGAEMFVPLSHPISEWPDCHLQLVACPRS